FSRDWSSDVCSSDLHANNKPLHDSVSLEKVAEESFGFSGAQLESVMNEAAIYAMRESKKEIEQRHLSMAIDKVMLGERTDRVSKIGRASCRESGEQS